MKRARIVLGVVAVGALAAAGTVTAVGAEGDASADGKAVGTYAEFSRLDQRSAGQFGAGDAVAGQWSWRTEPSGEFSVNWDQERPENRERFRRSADGEWLLLDGWGQKGTEYYEQRVTEEKAGDANCAGMKAIPSEDARQHYVRWNIPAEGYCLDAKGTVQEEKGGKKINFRHRQVWSPPAPCENARYKDQMCITQHEIWWDDNNHPYEKTLDRKVQLAKGLGMAFRIDQSFPKPWSAEMTRHWDY
ncbi:hypothetical protein [Streptomyces sp. HNM0574]|uniref:hypothetical protein n=1 Tax=Streptomyces sp. HNM0574 TaxID=2714954 RepID=UPI00146AE1B0|nr:hypothetical protein [Streptomyces sp. HNM0574]NLU67145.1 hypothetical protein [Streptomyces sp. HNM0574]